MHQKNLTQIIVALAFLITLLPLTTAAQPIIANFSDGETTSLPDGFTGSAGSGWAGGWSSPTTPQRGTLAFSVESSSPLKPGGGSYLTVRSTRTETGTIRAALRRQFDTTVVNPLNTHSIAMSVRFDHFDSGSWFFYANHSSTTSPGVDDTWMVVADQGVGWRAVTGRSAGGSPLYTNMNLAVVVGVTYDITLHINPTEQTYDLFVEGSNGTSGELLGNIFKTTSTSSAILDASWLNYYASPSSVGDQLNYSIDSISIIPEPSSTAVAISTLIILLTLGYRARRRASLR